MNYKVFQYLPMSKPKALSKMLPKIIKANANVVLDLKDSAQDTLKPINTPLLKEDARQSIPILINELLKKNIDSTNNIYIRINAFESGELEKDIEIIDKICEKVDNIGIFTPMIKKVEDLYQIKELLADNFKRAKIVPIIETVEGYNNLANILEDYEKLNIEYIHYGHYDYSLDSKQWPFVEQDELIFWDFIREIINLIENSNMKYMHTPFGNLTNEQLYKTIIKKLTHLCNNDFAITALNYSQVCYAQDVSQAYDLEEKVANITDQYQIAKDIVDIFENNQCSKRSFSVDIKKAKFLTPHEYKMAKRYLEKMKNERN